MKQVYLMIGALLIVFAQSFAQSDSTSQSIPVFKKSVSLRTTSFVFDANLNLVWLKNMQQVLRVQDFPTSLRFARSIPFEVGVRFQDWMFGLNLALPFSSWEISEPRMLVTSLFAERSLVKSRNYRLNFGLGASYYEYGFTFTKNEPNRQVDFQDLLTTSFLSTPVVSNKGGAFDVTVSLSNREKKHVSVGNCFRLGYRRGFTRYPWKSQSFELLGAPKDQLDMLYFQYLISLSKSY